MFDILRINLRQPKCRVFDGIIAPDFFDFEGALEVAQGGRLPAAGVVVNQGDAHVCCSFRHVWRGTQGIRHILLAPRKQFPDDFHLPI
jgi:hypothetical protein